MSGVLVFFAVLSFLMYGLSPVYGDDLAEKNVLIKNGLGLGEIADILKEEHLIRSTLAFKIAAVLKGDARDLKSGLYELSPKTSVYALLNAITKGGASEVEVLVLEGATLKEIDQILAQKKIIAPNELINYQKTSDRKLEGFLFPDTYKFFVDSDIQDVADKFLDNFSKKTAGLLNKDDYKTLILASLLEKEVPDFNERRVVAGILQKRLLAGWPLQVDATVCYAKTESCYPISPLDLKIDSPYNTYAYKGLPPTPISNPGLEAIKAAKNPQKSSYWFYLSHSKTGKTIFSQDLDEHNLNKSLYLK